MPADLKISEGSAGWGKGPPLWCGPWAPPGRGGGPAPVVSPGGSGADSGATRVGSGGTRVSSVAAIVVFGGTRADSGCTRADSGAPKLLGTSSSSAAK